MQHLSRLDSVLGRERDALKVIMRSNDNAHIDSTLDNSIVSVGYESNNCTMVCKTILYS